MTNWQKVSAPVAMLMDNPSAKAFQKPVMDGHLTVLMSIDDGDLHMSISHRYSNGKPGRYPTWDEIKEARYRFCPPRMTMAMLLPPKSEYVNVHPTTFHLWELHAGQIKIGG